MEDARRANLSAGAEPEGFCRIPDGLRRYGYAPARKRPMEDGVLRRYLASPGGSFPPSPATSPAFARCGRALLG